jgi:hypothetical protein
MFALLGMFFLITQYLQFALNYSPLATGLRIAPLAAVLLVAAPLSILLTHKFGTKPVVTVGLLLIATGLGLLSRTTTASTYLNCLPWFALIGAGVGFAMAPSTDAVMGSLPQSEAGVGSATSDTSMQVGGALGVAVLGTALSLRYRALLTPLGAPVRRPPGVRPAITGSLGGAQAVATAAHSPALATVARHAFISGMDQGLFVASFVVAAAALVVLLALPNRHTLDSTTPAPSP